MANNAPGRHARRPDRCRALPHVPRRQDGQSMNGQAGPAERPVLPALRLRDRQPERQTQGDAVPLPGEGLRLGFQYQDVRGDVHTNGIDSPWPMIKRAHKGALHKLNPKHSDRYVQKFAGRHNLRELDTLEQMGAILALPESRLRYKGLLADNGQETRGRGRNGLGFVGRRDEDNQHEVPQPPQAAQAEYQAPAQKAYEPLAAAQIQGQPGEAGQGQQYPRGQRPGDVILQNPEVGRGADFLHDRAIEACQYRKGRSHETGGYGAKGDGSAQEQWRVGRYLQVEQGAKCATANAAYERVVFFECEAVHPLTSRNVRALYPQVSREADFLIPAELKKRGFRACTAVRLRVPIRK